MNVSGVIQVLMDESVMTVAHSPHRNVRMHKDREQWNMPLDHTFPGEVIYHSAEPFPFVETHR